MALAYGLTGVLRSVAPPDLPRADGIGVDGVVLGFAALAAGLSAVAAALGPVLGTRFVRLQEALSEGARTATAGLRAGRYRDRLVAAEIALALVLSIGAGLLLRSFDRLIGTELGFEPEGRVAVQVFAYTDRGAADTLYLRAATEAIARVPGVLGVALTTSLPGADDRTIAAIENYLPVYVEDRGSAGEGRDPRVNVVAISGSYPGVLGIHLVKGETFDDDALRGAPAVEVDQDRRPVIPILVNEAFVRRHLGPGAVLGRRIVFRGRQETVGRIRGVLADVRRRGPASEPQPEVYVPQALSPSGTATFVAHVGGPPRAMVEAVQEALWSVNPLQAQWAARSLPDLHRDWLRQRTFTLTVVGAFALVALLLAAIGVYALMSFTVEQRAGEFGIRRALGAEGSDVARLVLRHGGTVAAAGVATGLAAAALATRFLRSLLFAVEPLDPPTFAALGGLVLVLALAAALIPARRATRVDPLEALRAD
ncbi:MAG: FtsX-like permease family protein [Gemmatimonadetes bacterium]|nr:MAG: FtsX-like permease family protein [Gemmatimonadota bacterium]